jgi:hypothetical protein
MFRIRIVPCVAAFAAAAALSACDGGSDEPGALSKSDFASKANAHCDKTESERAALLQQLPAQPSGQADAQTVQRLATADRELLRRVDALVPPPAEQDAVDRVLGAWRQRADLEDRYASTVRSMQAPQSLETFTAEIAQLDQTVAPVANELGMTQCAGGAS